MFLLLLLKASDSDIEHSKTQPTSPQEVTPILKPNPNTQPIEKRLPIGLNAQPYQKNHFDYSWIDTIKAMIFLPNTILEFLSELGKG